MPAINHLELEKLVTAIFQSAGAPPGHAQTVAEHLVESNLTGHDSHGVMRVSQYMGAINSGQLLPAAEPKIVQENVSGAVLDGQSTFGQVAAQLAMKLAISKARETGIGAVTVRNCYHSGRLAAHSALAVREEMIGIAMVNAGGGGQSVSPFGGRSPRLATNPISIASPPADPFPLVLDIATSVAPEGKVRDYLQRGETLPAGWVVDSEGRASTNPKDFYGPPNGALLPFGGPVGYKGFGLALMVDILAGALSGAGACNEELVPARDGILAMALDVGQYSLIEDFHRHVLQLVEHVKSCPTAPGYEEVCVPGELEHRAAKQMRQSGVPIPDQIWREITLIAEQLNVSQEAHPVIDGYQNGLPVPASSKQAPNPI